VHQPRIAISRSLAAAVPESEIRISQKSEIAFALDRIFDNFFSRLTGDQDEDMLIECFVESRESRFADFALEKMTASVLGNLAPADRDVDQELSKFIETVAEIDPDQQGSGQSVFIVGPTGAGKTTFLDRFFKKTLSNALRRRCIVVRVNCLDFSGRTDTLISSITEILIRSFEQSLYPSGHPTFVDLQGLYHTEYVRRAEGTDAQLYGRDKGAFKEKFGDYLNGVVQQDREGYLKRLLTDVVHNRKQLPIIVFDNTDEFTLEFKSSIFQFAQSLRRHAQYCLLIFPLTDYLPGHSPRRTFLVFIKHAPSSSPPRLRGRYSQAHRISKSATGERQLVECAISRLFPDRGYGFVRLADTSSDAFFHYSVVPAAKREKLQVNGRLRVNLGQDRAGKGLQVKAIVDFLEPAMEVK
jgi:cold shock CspA family protein/GTPase SAR1 family protein